MRANPSDLAAKDEFLAAKNLFRNKCKLARRQKWRTYCNEVTDPKKLSKFSKILNRNDIEHISLFKT